MSWLAVLLFFTLIVFSGCGTGRNVPRTAEGMVRVPGGEFVMGSDDGGRQRPNGNLPYAAGLSRKLFRGAMSSAPAAGRSRIGGRELFLIIIPAKMAFLAEPASAALHRTATGFMTWPEMFGNGRRIDMRIITTRSRRSLIRKARRRVLSAPSAEVRGCARKTFAQIIALPDEATQHRIRG